MRKKVQINNEGIESTIKKDYKEALVEYVLNAFEANATEVTITSSSNGLDGLDEIVIKDNGIGISHDNLGQTFEAFLTSTKLPLSKPISFGKNKGKGRYSFIGFANRAEWKTIYQTSDGLFSYAISLSATQKDYVEFDETPIPATDTTVATGTEVTISGFSSLTNASMDMEFIEEPLQQAFAWYLYLKRAKGYRITINGIALDYKRFIDTELSEDTKLSIDGNDFNVYFVKWANNIKARYFFYFLDDTSSEKYKKHTKFNNNAIEFNHSVYVESAYFNDFVALSDETVPETQIIIGESSSKNQRSDVFKKLLEGLNKIVESKLRQFVRKDADRLVEKMEADGGFPKFGDSAFDAERKTDFVNAVKSIYCVEPRVFKGLKKLPQQSILGFLNLLLFSDERENIITIIEEIRQLTADERSQLVEVFQYAKLSNVLKTVKLLSDRLKIIELLKKLIYDNEGFATERSHIQKVVEDNFWLFGEEFHLVTADKNFEVALTEYLHVIDGSDDTVRYSIANQERLRRPDIFICKKRGLEQLDGSPLEQNIIVELKAPQIVLSKKVYRQIEDYMDLIIKEPKFNSQLRFWRFIVVCKTVDEDIKNLYKSCEIHNKRFLTRHMDTHEIYAMTWDDVFMSYELRYSTLLRKLDIDRQKLLEPSEASVASKAEADRLRDEILVVSSESKEPSKLNGGTDYADTLHKAGM